MQQRESESQNIKENIDNILQKVSGDRADIAYIIYEQIVKCPGAEPEILKYFYEYSGGPRSRTAHVTPGRPPGPEAVSTPGWGEPRGSRCFAFV